jgi:hypothetical protein
VTREEFKKLWEVCPEERPFEIAWWAYQLGLKERKK